MSFKSCLHIGIEGIGQERIDEAFRSDALFGAIVQCWQLLYNDDWQALLTQEPFSVTTCFPVASGQRFYPVPCGALDKALLQAKGSVVKKWKRILYVSEPAFQGILKGNAPQDDCLLKDRFLAEHSEADLPETYDIEVPRIALDPASGSVVEGAFFYCTNRYMPPGDGLFFLARFTGSDAQRKFEAALNLLGDTGIGGDRSIGRGLFTWKREEFSLELPKEADWHVSLSLYHPTRAEVQNGILSRSRYSLVRRHGFVSGFGARSLRRKALLMIEEGAVFRGSPPVGDSPVVLPQDDGGSPFNVIRYGRAFTLPAKGGCFEQHT